jgi:hypothetical protein
MIFVTLEERGQGAVVLLDSSSITALSVIYGSFLYLPSVL